MSNAHRNTSIVRQCSMFLTMPSGKERLAEHCVIQANRPNVHGEQQHRRINPRRQLKKLVKRMVDAGHIQLS
jgi:hypothetical protein